MMTPNSTYARFAPFVRRRLAALGVREADLPDLCQEVFMVVHGKGDTLASVDRMDLWLREICRRIAAGYRRRAGHRLEVLGWDDAECADPGAERADEPDHGPMLALLRRALNHLDDESRDLLALHDVGEMPLSELARLVAHDRKTVRSRLVRARRRVSHWVSGHAVPGAGVRSGVAPRITPAASPFMRDQAARGRVAGCAASELQILRVSPEHCSGALGNVTVSDWRGPHIGVDMLDSVMAQAPYTLEKCGGEIAYLALIEPTLHPPALDVRQRIVDALEVIGPYFRAFAVVLLGDNARINQPILEGLTLLARPRFPMHFFSCLPAAAGWLCDTVARCAEGPLAANDLVAAAESVRRLQPERHDERRHAQSFPAVRA
jgi:RNA polymerase sigma-70 factor (ECF subfamily)